jgi:hypothetical protein
LAHSVISGSNRATAPRRDPQQRSIRPGSGDYDFSYGAITHGPVLGVDVQSVAIGSFAETSRLHEYCLF